MNFHQFLIFMALTLFWMFFQTARAQEVIVAVIDTGLEVESLKSPSSLWVNSGESGLDQKGRDKSKNGIDDDKNGFVDDANGFNFAGMNSQIRDFHGHGTHVTGIIHRLNPQVKIMVLKYYEPSNPQMNIENTAKAIAYAVKMGAHVINYSGGGHSPDKNELAALKEAEKKGVLVIAASGNDGRNNDFAGFYPASYPLSNIVSVGSSSKNGEPLSSSNYGPKSVHVVAEGENIFAPILNSKFGAMTGTSQAAAYVSGVASLIFQERPQASDQEVKAQLLLSGSPLAFLKTKTKYKRKVEASRALAYRNSNRDAFDRPLRVAESLFENDFLFRTQ